jgi:hypothetical protein
MINSDPYRPYTAHRIMAHRMKRHLKKALREFKYFSPLPSGAKYFALLAQERTGSTLFSDLLSFHPKILMDRHHFYTTETWPDGYQSGHRIFSRKPVRGYKCKVTHTPRQSSPEEARSRLLALSDHVSIIRLKRENKLRQALSAINAQTPLHKWKDTGGGPEETDKAVIDVDRFIESISYYDVLTQFEDEALTSVPHYTVLYEEDLLPQDQHAQTANEAFQFLGLKPAPVETRLKKISKPNPYDDIANFDELCDAIADTPYSKYLADIQLSPDQ